MYCVSAASDGVVPSALYPMLAPTIVVDIVTVCAKENVPPAGAKVGSSTWRSNGPLSQPTRKVRTARESKAIKWPMPLATPSLE